MAKFQPIVFGTQNNLLIVNELLKMQADTINLTVDMTKPSRCHTVVKRPVFCLQ